MVIMMLAAMPIISPGGGWCKSGPPPMTAPMLVRD
jgi:hypothetical protein